MSHKKSIPLPAGGAVGSCYHGMTKPTHYRPHATWRHLLLVLWVGGMKKEIKTTRNPSVITKIGLQVVHKVTSEEYGRDSI